MGPPPNIMIFFLLLGSASHSEFRAKFLWYVEYIYGVNDLNSAAHVSTFLKTGTTFKTFLFLLTTSSFNFVSLDNLLSENPHDLILLNSI